MHSGSLTRFFDTKHDLLVAVLEAYRAGINSMLLESVCAETADPVERVFALLDSYVALEANFTAWTSAVRGCLQENSWRGCDAPTRVRQRGSR